MKISFPSLKNVKRPKLVLGLGAIVIISVLGVGATAAFYQTQPQPTPSPTMQPVATVRPSAIPSASPLPTPSATPTARPTSKPTARPTASPSASPTPTTSFDLHLERVALNSIDKDSRGVQIDALDKKHHDLEEHPARYTPRISVRNNGHEPALNVKVIWTVDGKAKEEKKDKIDPGQSAHFEFSRLSDDHDKHTVKVSVQVDQPESRKDNNSYEFTYKIR